MRLSVCSVLSKYGIPLGAYLSVCKYTRNVHVKVHGDVLSSLHFLPIFLLAQIFTRRGILQSVTIPQFILRIPLETDRLKTIYTSALKNER